MHRCTTPPPPRPSPSSWELAIHQPGAPLRGLVGDLAAYRETASVPVRRREIPAARLLLICNLGEPLQIEHAGGEHLTIPTGGGFVTGLQHTWSHTATPGQQEGIEVRLSPAGASQLLGSPLADLAGRTVPLADAAPWWPEGMAEQLQAMPPAARLSAVETLLTGHITGPSPMLEVQWAWRQLRRSHGQLPIAALAAELGWSHKRLATRFREQIGVAPKQAARLLRFTHTVAHPAFASGADWSALALDCGYCDQSHLIREVQAFAGDTPAGLARRRLLESAGFAAEPAGDA